MGLERHFIYIAAFQRRSAKGSLSVPLGAFVSKMGAVMGVIWELEDPLGGRLRNCGAMLPGSTGFAPTFRSGSIFPGRAMGWIVAGVGSGLLMAITLALPSPNGFE